MPRFSDKDHADLKQIKIWQYETLEAWNSGDSEKLDFLIGKINETFPFPRNTLSKAQIDFSAGNYNDLASRLEPYQLARIHAFCPGLKDYPLWKGEQNKTILIVLDRWGYGDSFNFINLVFSEIGCNNNLLFSCPKPIERLLVNSFSNFKVWDKIESIDCVVNSWMWIFIILRRLASESLFIGNYLIPPPYSDIKENIFNTDRLRIGFCWLTSERIYSRRDPEKLENFIVSNFDKSFKQFCLQSVRDSSIEIFSPLFELTDHCKFYSLLPDPISVEASKYYPFMDLTVQLQDFADTAWVIERLDLVITVDTAVAHLAGAMGKPVWVLLPYNNDLRWGESGETTGWYPSMRLFRQPAVGDWESVIERVKSELESRIKST